MLFPTQIQSVQVDVVAVAVPPGSVRLHGAVPRIGVVVSVGDREILSVAAVLIASHRITSEDEDSMGEDKNHGSNDIVFTQQKL